jgi:hypothetical protein
MSNASLKNTKHPSRKPKTFSSSPLKNQLKFLFYLKTHHVTCYKILDLGQNVLQIQKGLMCKWMATNVYGSCCYDG